MKYMELQTKIHAPWESKEVVERLVEENVENKLNSYLAKFDGDDVEGIIEITIEKNKKSLFNGKLQINIDGNAFRYEREDYQNLDDLVNNLFQHFKEELAK